MWIMRSITILLAGAVALLGGCGPSVEVNSVYGPGVRFSEHTRSYAWSPASARTTGVGRPVNPSADRLIRELIDAHLARKGFEKISADGEPDFWVDYGAGKNLRGDAYDLNKPMYQRGRLEITAVTPGTSDLIWRGSAETKLDETASPEANRERLDMIIGKVIEQVPSIKRK